MENPSEDIRNVVRAVTEPAKATDILDAVDKYFARDAVLVHPLLNTPPRAGRDGVKAAYKLLRVFTKGNAIEFHTVAFDRIHRKQGFETRSGFLDLTESLKLRFVPLPGKLNPTFYIRFIVRLDLRKSEQGEGLWYIIKQEDNLPSDLGSIGIPGVKFISDTIKWVTGVATMAVGGTLAHFGWL